MRVAAGSAKEAARPIAQPSWRVVMALKTLIASTVMVAGFGKARVNRIQNAPLLAERDRPNQAPAN
jgi:hypothetical protein